MMYATSLIALCFLLSSHYCSCKQQHHRLYPNGHQQKHVENVGRVIGEMSTQLRMKKHGHSGSDVTNEIVQTLRRTINGSSYEKLHVKESIGSQRGGFIDFELSGSVGEVRAAILKFTLRALDDIEETSVVVTSENNVVLAKQIVQCPLTGYKSVVVLLDPYDVNRILSTGDPILSVVITTSSDRLLVLPEDADFDPSMSPTLQLVTRSVGRGRREEKSIQSEEHPLQCSNGYTDCCVATMEFVWEDHGIKNVIAPAAFVSTVCQGDCKNDRNIGIRHQSEIFYDIRDQIQPKFCCVPTQYSNQQMIFFDENDKVTVRYINNFHIIYCKCR